MSVAIVTRIIKIGNSQGIRIPKMLLEQSGLDGEVKIEVEGDKLTISRANRSRQGWDEAFALMAVAGDDRSMKPLQQIGSKMNGSGS